MKLKEVMEVLRISRSTLRRFRKEGKVKAIRLPNGRYECDKESVYRYYSNRRKLRKIVENVIS